MSDENEVEVEENVEVKLVRDGVYIGGEELSKGVHSVGASIAKKWLARGIAILPGDDPEEKAKAGQAKDLTKAKAEIKKLKAEVKKLTEANAELTKPAEETNDE